MKVSLTRPYTLWELRWLNPPYTPDCDRPGIPSDTHLCGYLARADAMAKAAAEGWEVVE